MNVSKLQDENRTTGLFCHSAQDSVNPGAVLLELFQLLEEYAPTWYTADHHCRAVAALQSIDSMNRRLRSHEAEKLAETSSQTPV